MGERAMLSGHSFMATYDVTLGLAGELEVLIEIAEGSKGALMKLEISPSGEIEVGVYEQSTRTPGVSIPEVNCNRQINGSSDTVSISHGPGGEGDGNWKWGYHVGDKKAGPGAIEGDPVMLKTGCKYLVKVISRAAANKITFCARWIERSPRDQGDV